MLKPIVCPFCSAPINANHKWSNEFTYTCRNCGTFGRIATWEIRKPSLSIMMLDTSTARLYAMRSRDLYLVEFYE
ncbi:MAG: hypothetical protein M0P69_09400 [Bacteroidales bacterium]|nr:hypothetical protein [Bacteroidales bacterium]